jgi:S-adenosyl methyltransferase
MTIDKFRARDVDVTQPAAARLYDYYLGGDAHYAVDKIFAERMFKICPYLDTAAHHNRGFLQRASRYMVTECGIRQFLDIGSGIPTVGNTHHVVREVCSDAPVVYVDNDLEAVNQSHDLLTHEGAENVAIIEADLRHVDSILDHPDTQRLIDFDKPLGLLIVSVWPFLSADDHPYELMACYRDRLASGSHVAMSHGTVAEASAETREMFAAVAQAYDETRDPVTQRDRQEFTAFFDGFTIVEPGVVYCPDWRPLEPVNIDDPIRPCNFAAVGRKP